MTIALPDLYEPLQNLLLNLLCLRKIYFTTLLS
jgi:hypothetical protein